MKTQRKKVIKINKLTFGEAISRTLVGEKVTRIGWNNKEFYVCIITEKLYLHKPDGSFYLWILSTDDIRATDWILA